MICGLCSPNPKHRTICLVDRSLLIPASTTSITSDSLITPVQWLIHVPSLRAYLTTYVNPCWVFGQFPSSAVLKSVANETGPIDYKLPYGLQWIWPVPLIIGIALAPDSPWWLVRKGRLEEAKTQVLRLTSRNQTGSGFDANDTVNMMVYTNELEKASTSGSNYLDCFKGADLRRTEIVCMV
jgi:SP family general alpha glucoside:H+ symporter-like MFS transporter